MHARWALPLLAVLLWAALTWPTSWADLSGGALAAALVIGVGAVWTARVKPAADPPPPAAGAVPAALALIRASAVRIWPTAWRLAFGAHRSGYLRVRRPAARPGQGRLGWMLHLLPGAQTVSIDNAGLLVHVLDEDHPPLSPIRDLDPQSPEAVP